MLVAIVVGFVLTAVALFGLIGHSTPKLAKSSQLFVYGLPIGIVAAGYTAGVGINIGWTLVAVIAAFVALLIGGLRGPIDVTTDEEDKPVAAGLNLVCSGAISLGLAVVVLIWAAHLISAFSFLHWGAISTALVLAAVACGIGGRSELGMARTVMIMAIIGAVVMFAVGFVAGDISGLTSPQVPVPSPNAAEGILYAVGILIIGAGHPVMRSAGVGNRSRVVVASILVTVVVLVTLVGILSLYGGSFNLPSLVINTLPVYTPPALAAVLCALFALVSSVTAGSAIRQASGYVGQARPELVAPTNRVWTSPRLWVNLAMGAAVLVVVWLAPKPTWIVLVLAVLGIANLFAERAVSKARKAPKDDAADNAEKAPVDA